VTARLTALSGEWATVGTGWQAWPEMANDTGLTLTDGGVSLPEAQDMLPIAEYQLSQGRTVAVEHAEPVYLRNSGLEETSGPGMNLSNYKAE
jgi:tRNA threonylcarbamoyladenosine biosynthesis protein TsaB